MLDKFNGKYLTGLGLDVSDHHVRFAVVSKLKGVVDLFELILPEGVVEDEKIIKEKDLKKFIELGLNKLRCPKFGPIKTTLLVPESRVFSASIVLSGKIDDSVIRTEAVRRAQKMIPVPFSQAAVSVAQGEKIGDGAWRTNVYVCQKEIVAGLINAVQNSLLTLVAAEANSKAILHLYDRFADRAEKAKNKEGLICVIDIGHSWSTLSVYTPRGSSLFSRTLSHKAQVLTPESAPVLPETVVDTILQTLDETKKYFAKQNLKITRTLLNGIEAANEKLLKAGEEGEVAAVGNLLVVPMVSGEELHRFGPAIGAAYRSLNPKKFVEQHNFLAV